MGCSGGLIECEEPPVWPEAVGEGREVPRIAVHGVGVHPDGSAGCEVAGLRIVIDLANAL